jgi:hypothetical protein
MPRWAVSIAVSRSWRLTGRGREFRAVPTRPEKESLWTKEEVMEEEEEIRHIRRKEREESTSTTQQT